MGGGGEEGRKRSRIGGDDAEELVGSVVCAGDQMERRQGEEVGRRIKAVARGWGWKE